MVRKQDSQVCLDTSCHPIEFNLMVYVDVVSMIADITCSALVTLETTHHMLLSDKQRFALLSSIFLRADLSSEVAKLSEYCVCRFLVFKRQDDSN